MITNSDATHINMHACVLRMRVRNITQRLDDYLRTASLTFDDVFFFREKELYYILSGFPGDLEAALT